MKAIAWERVRERLRASEQALAAALEPDREKIEAVRRNRAERLARPPAAAPTASPEMLVVRLGEERYGIPLAELAEVLAAPPVAPVPGGPRELVGVAAVRGQIRPVWDLRRLLRLPEPAEPAGGPVLLLRRPLALRVDAAEGIQRLAGSATERLQALDLESLLREMEHEDADRHQDPAGVRGRGGPDPGAGLVQPEPAGTGSEAHYRDGGP